MEITDRVISIHFGISENVHQGFDLKSSIQAMCFDSISALHAKT